MKANTPNTPNTITTTTTTTMTTPDETKPAHQGAPSGLLLGHSTPHPFTLVPLTGTLPSVRALLLTLLDPLEPFFSPLRARVRVPGATAVRFDQTASEIEGFCRPLWGLACLLAGGGEYKGTQWWVDGLKAGTDEGGDEYWGWPRDNDQRMVEMCPLGFALAVAPGIWEGLGEGGRGAVERWLGNSVNGKE